MSSLLTNIKSKKVSLKDIFPYDTIIKEDYLNLHINGRHISGILELYPQVVPYFHKLIYEDPDDYNCIVLDGTYLYDNLIKGFSRTNLVFHLNDPNFNLIQQKFKYNKLKFVNMQGIDAYINFNKRRSFIKDWTFDFNHKNSLYGSMLYIFKPRGFKNCTFQHHCTININGMGLNDLTSKYYKEYDLFINDCYKRFQNCTFDDNHNSLCGMRVNEFYLKYQDGVFDGLYKPFPNNSLRFYLFSPTSVSGWQNENQTF